MASQVEIIRNEDSIHIKTARYNARFERDGDNLKIASSQNYELVSYRLGGTILFCDGRACALKLHDQPFPDLQVSGDQCVMKWKLSAPGIGIQGTATMKFLRDYFTYQVEISGQTSLPVEEIVYGSRSGSQLEDGSYVHASAMKVWSPDLYSCVLPKKGVVSASLSSRHVIREGYFRSDAGRFIIPPYVAAFGDDQWWGVGTMEIPTSMDGLLFVYEEGYVKFPFCYKGGLSIASEQITHFPLISFLFGTTADEVLSQYTAALSQNKLIPQMYPWEQWWSGPIYCTIGDQIYHDMIETGQLREVGGVNLLTETFTKMCFQTLEDKEIPWEMAILDAGWMDGVATWNPNRERFPDLRRFIDECHARGKKIVLWLCPFNLELLGKLEREFIEEHRDWIIEPDSGTPLLDYSHPGVRNHMQSVIHNLLSEEEGCLNADGFKVDFYYHVPAQDSSFHDSSWPKGEKLVYEVLKFIYDASKKVKSDAFIEGSAANPFFNDTQDACRLNDDVTNNPRIYPARAQVTILSGASVPDTDDWWSYTQYFVPMTVKKSVFGIPALYAVRYRGEQGHMLNGYGTVAPGGIPVSIDEADYRRVSAVLKTYLHSPIDNLQERFIDLRSEEMWRKYTSGPLNGFYAAYLLQDGNGIACYQEGVAKIAAIAERTVKVPVPAGSHANRLVCECVDHQEEATFSQIGGFVIWDAEDAGKRGATYVLYWEDKP